MTHTWDIKTPDPAGVMMLDGPMAFSDDGRSMIPPPAVRLRGPAGCLIIGRPIPGAAHVDWVLGTYVIDPTPVGWVGRWLGMHPADGMPGGPGFHHPPS